MTRRVLVRKFDPKKKCYARKKFNANGRQYKSGDLFDWHDKAVNIRRIRQLYDAHYIDHGDEIPEPLSNRQVNMAEIPDDLDTEIATSDDLVELSPDPVDIFDLETEPTRIGGGWYELSNGERVQGKFAAYNAEANLK